MIKGDSIKILEIYIFLDISKKNKLSIYDIF